MWVSNFEVMGPPTEMESETGVSEGMGGTVGEIGLTLGAGVIICGSENWVGCQVCCQGMEEIKE